MELIKCYTDDKFVLANIAALKIGDLFKLQKRDIINSSLDIMFMFLEAEIIKIDGFGELKFNHKSKFKALRLEDNTVQYFINVRNVYKFITAEEELA